MYGRCVKIHQRRKNVDVCRMELSEEKKMDIPLTTLPLPCHIPHYTPSGTVQASRRSGRRMPGYWTRLYCTLLFSPRLYDFSPRPANLAQPFIVQSPSAACVCASVCLCVRATFSITADSEPLQYWRRRLLIGRKGGTNTEWQDLRRNDRN